MSNIQAQVSPNLLEEGYDRPYTLLCILQPPTNQGRTCGHQRPSAQCQDCIDALS
jgi:hypothetical protein